MPRIVLQKMRAGDRKWYGPLLGLVFIRFLMNCANRILFRLIDPEMTICSHRTITTFLPHSNCFATIDVKRPNRCPRPSMTTTSDDDISTLDRPGREMKGMGRGGKKEGPSFSIPQIA